MNLESPRGLANARLIAAAPEMLSLLEEFITSFISHFQFVTEQNQEIYDIMIRSQELVKAIKDDATLPQN